LTQTGESPTPLFLALSISKPRGECHCTKRIDASQIGTPRRVLAPGAVPCCAHDPRLFVGPMALDPPTAAHGMTPRGRWEEPFRKRRQLRAKPCPLTARGRKSISMADRVTRQRSPTCSEESTPPHRLPLEAARSLDAGLEVGSASSLEVKSEPKIPLNPVPVTVPWSGHRENRSIHESTCLPPQLARRRRTSHD